MTSATTLLQYPASSIISVITASCKSSFTLPPRNLKKKTKKNTPAVFVQDSSFIFLGCCLLLPPSSYYSYYYNNYYYNNYYYGMILYLLKTHAGWQQLRGLGIGTIWTRFLPEMTTAWGLARIETRHSGIRAVCCRPWACKRSFLFGASWLHHS